MTGPVFRIEKVVHGGLGLVRDRSSVILVPYVLPGEEVRVEVSSGRAGALRGKVREVVTPSPDRVSPRCALYGRCGGCQLQHASYPAQLTLKRLVLEEDLARLAHWEGPVENVRPAPAPFNYRSRLRLHLQAGRSGFYAEGKKEFLPVECCHLADDRLNRALPALVQGWARGKGASELTLGLDDDGSLYAVVKRGPVSDVLALAGDEVRPWTPAGPRKFAFQQVNAAQNRVLQELVSEFCRAVGPDIAVELYAGTGNLTAAVLAWAGRVAAVDSDPEAIALARKNFPEGSSRPVEFLAQHAEVFLAAAGDRGLKPDLILLDPPRQGARAALAGILRLRPRAIIYVSCDSATLARDLKDLIAAGYRLHSVSPLDMFPQTAHLETVVGLIR